MSATKPIFKDIDFNVVAAADRFAKDNNVPEIVYPDKVAPIGQGVVPAQSANPPLPEKRAARRPAAAEASKATPVRRLAVELPEYLVREISDRAHNSETTIRYIVAQAFHKAGYFVAPGDLKEDVSTTH